MLYVGFWFTFSFSNPKDSLHNRVFFYNLKYQPNINENHKNEAEFILSLDVKNKKSIFTDVINRDAD